MTSQSNETPQEKVVPAAAEAKAAEAKPAKPAKRQKPTEKLAEFALAHGGLSMAATALVVCASLILLVWFILYSGISSSADFIYAQF